jgi:hypothetical protein
MLTGSLLAMGQIVSVKKVGFKTVMCMHSGLEFDPNDCGLHSQSYTYVFVGKIAALTPADHDEQQIQIIPEEVFAGEPNNTMTVITSQGMCFPDLVVGDSWLFYLRREQGKPIVLDYYGNDSLPLSQAAEKIATLRHLRTIGNRGILRGTVLRGNSIEGTPVSGARVIARRSRGERLIATTDGNGRFEFEALPAGTYRVSARASDSYRPDSTKIDVEGGECWDLTLAKDQRF